MAWHGYSHYIGDDFMFMIQSKYSEFEVVALFDLLINVCDVNVIRVTLMDTSDYEVREFRLCNATHGFDVFHSDDEITGNEWNRYYENMQGTFYTDTLHVTDMLQSVYEYFKQDALIEFIQAIHGKEEKIIDSFLRIEE